MVKSILGIDYGRKRIGLAISEAGLIARPLKTIENKGERKNLLALSELIRQYLIGTIVVGLPVHKNVSMSDEVKSFAKTLEPLAVKIIFQNEMLTSVAAESVRGNKSIDSIAATMILQDYLTSKTPL